LTSSRTSPPSNYRGLSTHDTVIKRMRELDAPESDYPRVLEQVLREEADR
jgi:hypothetical protein